MYCHKNLDLINLTIIRNVVSVCFSKSISEHGYVQEVMSIYYAYKSNAEKCSCIIQN